MAEVPLRRNRDFMLLQMGQLLSNAGTQATSIGYPLLVLAITHSAVEAGAAAFARTLPVTLLALPAGLAADRWSRKSLMIAADVVRVGAVGSLGAMILVGDLRFWPIAFVAFVEGSGAALFSACEAGALRAVVPLRQLPAASGAKAGRDAAVQLGGPPLGGALFGIGRALPFVADAISYAFSTLTLLGMRTRFEEERSPELASVRTRVAEGFRFLWRQPFLRMCALIFGISNFIGPGLLLALIVIGKEQGLSGARIGVLDAAFGAVLLLGSFASPLARRLLPVRTILLLELWAWVGCAAFVAWPSIYLLFIGMLPAAAVIPSTDSVVKGYRIAMTPDRLLGRVESARNMISGLIAPLGPLLAGVLLGVASARATIAFFATVALLLAFAGTLSRDIKHAPSLDELDDFASGVAAKS